MTKLCRLCIGEVEPLLDIFGIFGREQQMQQIVAKHFSLDIKEDDPLSDKMCTVCWSKLVDFHAFHYQIQKAQERITMIVIDEVKSEDMEYSDYVENKIIIADGSDEEAASSLEDFEAECNSDSKEKRINIVNIESESFQRSRYFSNKDLAADETIVQIQMMPKLKRSDLRERALQEDESSVHSNNDMPVEDSVQLFDVEEPIRRPEEDAEIMEPLSEPQPIASPLAETTTFTIKRLKRNKPSKNYIGQELETSSNRHSNRRRRKCASTKPVKREGCKATNEEQRQREVELIEDYYGMQCDLCFRRFEKIQTLFDHYHDEHKLRGYIICCGKKFFKRPMIAEHVTWHTQPENFTCTACGAIAENKRGYDNHMLTHAAPDADLYQCNHCAKRFTKRIKLEKHKLCHLKDEEKQHICDECDKPYASEALLRSHKRVVHQQTYAHMCEICAKVFKSRTFFEKHQLEHLGKNLPKVQCQICEAWMKNEHSMRAHMRNHQDEGQEHECDVCGKKGPSRNAIAKHKRFVHMSERKFKCTLCDKAFKRAITLKEHMTVHTGEVLYTCTFCPKTFNSSANMHAHRKKVHPTEWLEDKQSKLESNNRPEDGTP